MRPVRLVLPGALVSVALVASAFGSGAAAAPLRDDRPAGTTSESAIPPAGTPQRVVKDGMTQPVFSFADSIKETVFIETKVDSDGDGKKDRVAAYVHRPAETNQGLKVATIVEGSPYPGGVLDVPYHPVDVTSGTPTLAPWTPPNDIEPSINYGPIYYDNYFVPRGYAVVVANTLGTGESDGCPTAIGPNETAGMVAVVDWLNGRASAYSPEGKKVRASWSTGNVAMAGKSYDGTLALAAAGTGVAGLKTIVSLSGVSNWYDEYRANGAVVAPAGFEGEDADLHAKIVLTRRHPEKCAGVMRGMERSMDRGSGDYNAFWEARNYVKKVPSFKASVLLTAGLNDWNVKPQQFAQLWAALKANNVQRKLWLHQGAHDDPVDVRRQVWLDTVNKWFDYWLYGIQNGIMKQPRVDLETAPGQWSTQADWPAAAPKQGAKSSFAFAPAGAKAGAKRPPLLWFDDAPARKVAELIKSPEQADPNRILYLTPPMPQSFRLSGTPKVSVKATMSGQSPFLTALLVDYGIDERVQKLAKTGASWCFAESLPDNPGCRTTKEYVTASTPFKIVSRGWLDVRNRTSLTASEPIKPGTMYTLSWPLQPVDYVIKPNHRLGVVLLATDNEYTLRYPAGTRVAVELSASSVQLPIVAP
jgi:X-Pro dipeptidyl-peptidase